ncbi:pyruvate, water dikinase [Hydrogenivirga sp. 128-5-R1-1]|uniref:pyruvate, water dikinase n=1 Tax=Hydrogenivirga sp. 128-5-R1-1 TaxID=392423 RepID=UPI00015F35E0|nr:pyruvate, water dikinase [Hydrogenivirga sp. 128-5-R1-1]EDP74570.1 phosphoenolpyruvate synthase [Hydrogenivirga sp. 128-5-R1-1]
MDKEALVLWLDELSIEDIPVAGGKNASLGEMIKNLSPLGINIPYGFVVTSIAYYKFIEFNKLKEKIREALEGLNVNDVADLAKRGYAVRELIKGGEFPPELEELIKEYYNKLSERYNTHAVDVAVRSSATAEDLPDASFAGQQETYLNVVGAENVLTAIKNCFASLFTDRAISYRESFGFDHFNVGIAVGVQKMVRSDVGASGVMFTLDTETGFKDVVVINAIYGLGELIVQGMVTPDEYMVFKPTFQKGYSAIIEKKLGRKDRRMVYGSGEERVKIVNVPIADQKRFALEDDEILKLAEWGTLIEKHYSEKKGKWTPMDVEWAKDGMLNELFVVQARPETVHSRKEKNVIKVYKIVEPEHERAKKRLVQGIAVGDKIAAGKVRVLFDLKDAENFQEGEVLVTDITDPDWEPIMKKAAAIVTNRGGRTAHAAIVARELGIPAVVGTGNATEVLEAGMDVTVSCAEGETGYVYEGVLKFEVEEINIEELPRPKTRIMMNVGNPESAFRHASIPNDGVGLAREEFIIANYIKVHPLALIHYDDIKELYERLKEQGLVDDRGFVTFRAIYANANGPLKEKLAKGKEKRNVNLKRLLNDIDRYTFGYDDKKTYYIKKLSYGIAKISAAFYPNPVIVRFSDFKSNEYANLIGGQLFEPEEENPMIGWRGASRYYSPIFKEAFGMECQAILRVRNKMGLTNTKVMVPFCRTPSEGEKVLSVMEEFGLRKGDNGLEVYVMAELPSNVVLADIYADIFDGFSIGSNDLTQLTLGIDRDSELVAHLYDERNEAVKRLISQLISAAKKKDRKVGICGQAPSDFPDFAQFLVEQGIDSISLNPDSVLKTLLAVSEMEKKMGVAK